MSPLANASGDYCGDFCRSAIMGRFLAFFGWPSVTAVGLAIFGRWERRRPEFGSAERAAWSWTWAVVTIVLATVAADAGWRIILLRCDRTAHHLVPWQHERLARPSPLLTRPASDPACLTHGALGRRLVAFAVSLVVQQIYGGLLLIVAVVLLSGRQ